MNSWIWHYEFIVYEFIYETFDEFIVYEFIVSYSYMNSKFSWIHIWIWHYEFICYEFIKIFIYEFIDHEFIVSDSYMNSWPDYEFIAKPMNSYWSRFQMITYNETLNRTWELKARFKSLQSPTIQKVTRVKGSHSLIDPKLSYW